MNRMQNTSLGFYLPSFFRLHISTKKSFEDLNELSDIDFSVFFHEYVHFLQDISTYYGLNNTYSTVEYMCYANNAALEYLDKKFKVPIDPDPLNSDNVLLNNLLCKLTYGDVEVFAIEEITNYQLIDLPITITNSPIKEIGVVDISFKNKTGKEDIFTFGAGAIMESMAYLLEELTCAKYYESEDFPYKSALLIAKYIYPEFASNKLNVLALCDISLGLSNPAEYFVRMLEEWKNDLFIPEAPENLYNDFNKGEFSMNGTRLNTKNQIIGLASRVKSHLKGYFNDEHFNSIKEWVDTIIESALELRMKNPSFILDIANGNIRENKKFINIFKTLGTPLMTNDNSEFRFYPTKSLTQQIDIGHFWAINQIQSIFLGNIEPCEMIDFCNQDKSKKMVDSRCRKNPWTRYNDNELCPFALFWRHWNLGGFEPC